MRNGREPPSDLGSGGVPARSVCWICVVDLCGRSVCSRGPRAGWVGSHGRALARRGRVVPPGRVRGRERAVSGGPWRLARPVPPTRAAARVWRRGPGRPASSRSASGRNRTAVARSAFRFRPLTLEAPARRHCTRSPAGRRARAGGIAVSARASLTGSARSRWERRAGGGAPVRAAGREPRAGWICRRLPSSVTFFARSREARGGYRPLAPRPARIPPARGAGPRGFRPLAEQDRSGLRTPPVHNRTGRTGSVTRPQ